MLKECVYCGEPITSKEEHPFCSYICKTLFYEDELDKEKLRAIEYEMVDNLILTNSGY